jgi:transcriptional regulator of heat shock response
MRQIDTKKRENQILDLVVASHIKESKPISSSYLCQKHHLSYSAATVRNIMESLEKKGLLSHVHTSSGRVPTQEGFKRYVEHLREEEILGPNLPSLVGEMEVRLDVEENCDLGSLFNRTLDLLAEMSGYTSLVAISGYEERFFFRGTRFILNQPEFESISRLRSLFYALEVRINELQELLFNYLLDEEINILIGDDIGFEEISDCSLVISGVHRQDLAASLALLGPMRMDYVRAASTLYSIKKKLEQILRRRIADEA